MALDLTRIQAICFDIDGTLSDTDDAWTEAIARRLPHFPRFRSPSEKTHLARRFIMRAETPVNRVYAFLDRIGLDWHASKVLDGLRRLSKPKSRGNFHLIPGVHPMLAALHAHYPLAVVSARGEESSMAFLDQFGMRPLFRVIATAHTTPRTKPLPDPLLWTAEQLGLPPSACLMVGDTTVDILCARAAGAQSVGVLCGFGEESELRTAGADEILPTTALLHLLFTLPDVASATDLSNPPPSPPG